jgi:hypothetical protein
VGAAATFPMRSAGIITGQDHAIAGGMSRMMIGAA